MDIRRSLLQRKRFAALTLGVVAWLAAPSDGRAALFFFFEPTAVEAGARVTVRTAGTPAGFDDREQILPRGAPIRLYLVRNRNARAVRSRNDTRLHFVGSLVPDARGRGILAFRAPPLDTGAYAVAAWCPGCKRFGGSGFSVLAVDDQVVPRYRPRMLLRLRTGTAGDGCSATEPDESPSSLEARYGNGFLSVAVQSGGFQDGRRHADGTISNKLGWLPRDGFYGLLTVRGERLDALSPPLRVLVVNWGYSSTGKGSWMSAVVFPAEGCWRLTGRVRDISLTYVVRVRGI